MFDFFRRYMKLFMGVLFFPLIIGFVLFGVQGYNSFTDGKEVVAKVGGAEITRQELDNQHRNLVERYLAQNPKADRARLESEDARRETLERMVNDRVLALAVQKQHLQTADQRLVRELLQDPNIGRTPEGKLDTQRYHDMLRANGTSSEVYENSVRQDLARRQLLNGVLASGLTSQAAVKTASEAYFQRREVQVARFVPADFKAQVKVSDAEIEKFYQDNTPLFQTLEQVDLEYVVLDLDAVARRITPNEADVRTYFEQNNARMLAKDEKRRASHILLTVPAGASAEEKTKIKDKAAALLAELRKTPARFAELAKTHSQDPGSAPRGGDLDVFGRGAMVKPFEEAAFALDKGQISDLVESEFGFHIIQVTEVRKPVLPTYESVRAKLEQDYKYEQARKQFGESAETFRNLVYEQADALQPVADKLGLVVRKHSGLLRTGGAGEVSVLASPKLLAAVFAEESVRSKRNTEAVEVGSNQLVAARVLQHRPAALRPLPEVLAEVKERLQQQRAVELAVAEGKAKLQAWKDGTTASLPAAVVIARNQTQGQPGSVVAAALAAPMAEKSPAWVGVDLGLQGYAVVRVNQVLAREAAPETQVAQERQALGATWTQAEAQAYLQALKVRYKAQISAAKPENR